ncbi:hypothetical protein CCMSSC00406_0006637 [Pleurotus cornucopiae]|uniref:Uncharacterized protein n=1 Tax=Pleurotus cornucopiae TaxID=5321 RepID=A0ACB7IQ30_PLECO|nr:hypothetical protein CCMSSC00406_0006637 [Pleurotus cornucopiae]
MATKTEAASIAGSLQRGKACLRCRKRKMRCDGVKPACQQCIRAKKADGCEYDDGKGKTRTQILRETIARLENRIRELEDPEYISPAVTLYDPNLHQRSGSSSSISSAGGTPLSASHSPFASDSTNSPHDSWTHLPGVPSPSPSPFSPDLYFEEAKVQPPFELALMLLDIYAPHRQQSGLLLHTGRLRESLSLPPSEQRHPVLMNAIYLWACFISRPEPLCQHEEHYLARALEAIGEAIRLGNHALDVIQASCLLSMYFLSNGRILEGSYHASAAVGLAVQCGLHRGISLDSQSWIPQSADSFDIKPVKDLSESERVLTFWQVFNLDRCWAVVMRRPSVIPDGPDGWNSINTPWPLDIADYEAGQMHQGNSYLTVRSFLNGDVSGGYSTQAARAKATALFYRADEVVSNWDPRVTPSGSLLDDMQTLERAITQFVPSMIPIHQLDAASPEDKPAIIVAHTLAQATMIHLYRRFAQSDGVSYAKCLRAAHACVAIIKHLSEADFTLLEPIISHCWTDAADILMQELNNLETSWPLMNSSDVRNEIGVLLYAVTSLGSRFPLLAEQQNQPWMRPLYMAPSPRPISRDGMDKVQLQQQQQQPSPQRLQQQSYGLPAESPGSRLERSSTCRRVSRTTTQ